jgi:hypothetical protein
MFAPNVARSILGHSVSNALFLFPFIFGISVIGALMGTWLTQPEDEAVLAAFYKKVNPWGAWGPVREKVLREDPGFKPNPNFSRDMINVAVGIIWQLSLTALPIYLVLRQWSWCGAIAAVLIVTTVIIKFNWYDKLEKA